MVTRNHKYSRPREDGEMQYHVVLAAEGLTVEYDVWASDEHEARAYAKELLVLDFDVSVEPVDGT